MDKKNSFMHEALANAEKARAKLLENNLLQPYRADKMSYIPKDYVPVHERVQKMHDENEACEITTEHQLLWDNDTVVFKATVKTNKGVFNGTSFGSIWKDKALEKLETVAVWRALAFAWYEIQSWLASEDEMQRFNERQSQPQAKQADDDKPWFNDKDFDNMKTAIMSWKYSPPESPQELAKEIRKKYKLSKKNATRLEELY